MTMKTTPELRQKLRERFILGEGFDIVCVAVLDDLDEALVELAALRRVEAESLYVQHSRGEHEPRGGRWAVEGTAHSGRGRTLAEALADYDAKKEQR